ncbi:MAG: hypothetical protein A2Y15_04030 [Clostridiales bacterium GWF2_36_10]|nr:MAG: hypothetical protein A2Y15_04030 [Clostridiales bacterium GWF2_36_10]
MKNELFEKIKESIHPSDELVSSTKTRVNNQKHVNLLHFRTVAIFILLICLITGALVVSSLNFDKASNNNQNTVVISSETNSVDLKSIPIQRARGDFIIDVYNPNEFVGFADYVFIGYVNELVSTEYYNPYERKGKKYSTPITNYSITVVKNIKGNLKSNEPIIVQKHGGVYEDKSAIELWEDDELPEKGKMYVFIGITQGNSCLLISGPNSNIPLESNINRSNINDSKIVKQYDEAFINQIVYERTRLKSIYDEPSSEIITIESSF